MVRSMVYASERKSTKDHWTRNTDGFKAEEKIQDRGEEQSFRGGSEQQVGGAYIWSMADEFKSVSEIITEAIDLLLFEWIREKIEEPR